MSTTLTPIALSAPTTLPTARAQAPAGNPTLGQTLAQFYQFASPRMLTTFLLVAFAVRVWWAHWSWWDVPVATALIAWQPFNEWLIHTYILHWRPRKWGPFTIDFALGAKHRAHHLNPWHTPTLFIPLKTSIFAGVVQGALFFALLPTHALAMTALLTLMAIGCFYEWSHFMPHTAYRPQSAWWRKVVRNHRLHHFKNERYWMGVSSNLGDRVLGTLPDPKRVETSETARILATTE